MSRTITIENIKIHLAGAAALFLVSAGWIWYAASKNAILDFQASRLAEVEQTIKESPSREEFTSLKEQVTTINTNTNQILQLLIKSQDRY